MTSQMLEAEGRVVIITGASRGIGAAIARQLHDDGYSLSLGARDPDVCLSALGTFDETRVMAARFDAEEPESASAWVKATLDRFGRIDVLVNNAGILRMVTFEEDGEADLDALWAVNVKAPYRMIRLCLPHLRQAGHGRIINIASTDAKRYRDETVSIGYAMTKHALLALNHAARFAGWEDGVRATALCPGAVDTDLIAGIPGVTPGPNRIPTETIARTVSFLLTLPDMASVAEMPMNTRLESTI